MTDTVQVLALEDHPEEIDELVIELERLDATALSSARPGKVSVLNVKTQSEAEKAISESAPNGFHLILLDLVYPLTPGSPEVLLGLKWLPTLRRLQPFATVVVLTNMFDEKIAGPIVDAFRTRQVTDFLPKITALEDQVARIRVACQAGRDARERDILREEFREARRFRPLITYPEDVLSLFNSMKARLLRLADQVESGDPSAHTDAPRRIRSELDCIQHGLAKYGGLGTDPVQHQKIDLNRLLRNMAVLNRDLFARAQGSWAGPTQQVREISTYASDFRLALQEVIHNAADALMHSCTPIENREIRAEVVDHGSEVTITLTDNGCGFSDEAVDHMFEPGFTTWPDRKHAGLGLYIARRMMNAVGGDIHIRKGSNGAGTAVELTLPDLEAL